MFPAPPFLVSQGPVVVASRICTTPMTGESEEPWGKTAAGCQNSPATPRANSSRLQSNCCELQVASGSRSSRAGSQPKDLIFITIIHGWPLNLHIQVAQSPFFSGRLPVGSYPGSFSFTISPVSAEMLCKLSGGLF